MKKIRTAIIGCGGVCKISHLPFYLQSDEVEVVALCDIQPDHAQTVAQMLGREDLPIYEKYDEMMDAVRPDAVDICTPNVYHSVIAVAALERGIHVMCEKPDAISVKEAQKMKAAAEQSGKTLMVMRNNRYNPYSKWLKQYIEQGNLGEIYTARCAWQRRRGIPGKGGWFTTKALSGGGPLIDLGVHMIDLSVWLMGNPKPVAVSGCTYCKFAQSTTASDSFHSQFGQAKADGTFDVEDLAMGFIRFDNGACMQIEFSWASNVGQEKVFFDLRGTKAGASIDTPDGELHIFSEINGLTADITPHFPPLETGHVQNLRHFYNVILHGDKPDFEPIQGLNMIRILEAMYQSAALGREVSVEGLV